MANQGYNRGLKKVADFLSALDLRCLLLKSSYVFDADHNFVADVISGSKEISVAGYARQTLGTKTTSQDDTNDRGTLDSADIDFGALAAGQTIGSAVIYVFVTNDADSYLIGNVSTGGFPLPTNGGNVKIQQGANGWAFVLGA